MLPHSAGALRPLRFIVLWAGIAAVIAAAGGTPALAAAPAADASGARGLLWKIDGSGAKPSYVFGTIHIADPRVTRLPRPVREALDNASALLVEVVPDVSGLGRLARAMRFTDGGSLKQVVGARTYADARAAFHERGIPITDLDRYKPWAVTLMLSIPDPGDQLPLDLVLQQRAAKHHQHVEGLETMAEQIAVFDDLPLHDQRALLQATLRGRRAMAGRIEALVAAYLARDLSRLQSLVEQDELADRALTDMVTRRLLTDRNRRMVARMQSRLERGNAFIAVGAAHLPGTQGILELLRREGYRVRPVY